MGIQTVHAGLNVPMDIHRCVTDINHKQVFACTYCLFTKECLYVLKSISDSEVRYLSHLYNVLRLAHDVSSAIVGIIMPKFLI